MDSSPIPKMPYPWKLIRRLPHQTDSPNSLVTPPSIIVRQSPPREPVDISDLADTKLYTPHATMALTKFNSTQGTNFSFVKLVNLSQNRCGQKTYVHVNFIATDNGHCGASSASGGGGGGDDGLPPQIFYAEIIRIRLIRRISQDDRDSDSDIDVKFKGDSDSDSGLEDDFEYEIEDPEFKFEVKGCALLEKVDTANPLGMRCSMCNGMSVIHPGPRCGYRIVAGDNFECSDFMDYNRYKVLESLNPHSPWGRNKIKHTSNRLPMYTSCANQALKHFNNNEQSGFRLVKVLIAFSVAISFERIVHLNFLAEWPEKFQKPLLFFAESVVPMLTHQRARDWDTYVEQYIKVEGCCQLTKVDSGSVFGRVCEICINDVIHPGPRDGYGIEAGDHFKDFQFMESGNGIY